MPVQASLHLDVLSLFHTIWSNPDTTIHEIVKYVLKMSDDQSVTWAVHVRIICQLYALPDPLKLLQNEDAWPKSEWKAWCSTRVRSYHEKLWRYKAISNSKMKYLNIQLFGLNGHHHPALSGLYTTRDVEKLRPHIKMLTGDYLTYSRIASDRKSGDPCCRLCKESDPVPLDTIEHILTECRGTAEARERILPEMLNALLLANPDHIYLTHPPSLHKLDLTLAQFILDCTSFNLPDQYRLRMTSNNIVQVFCISRDLCYAAHTSRMKKLRDLAKNK